MIYDIILNIDPPTNTKTQEAWECDLGAVISEDCWEDYVSPVQLNLIEAVPQNDSNTN